jgi:serine protease
VGAVALVLIGSGSFASLASADANPHAYRHGVVPPLGASGGHAAPAVVARRAATATLAPSASNLAYGGGVTGSGYAQPVGVTTGPPKVYLVFWGSQWGTRAADDARGNVVLGGDTSQEAPRLQNFFRDLGTNNEQWSGVMTQYCEGVAAGTQFCPGGSAQVGYPTGGALAGVYVDESTSSTQTTGHQIAQEAVNAAAHFGNTTPGRNRNAQYFIVSPPGTHPDDFNSPLSWCAWHDYTGDSTLTGGAASSGYGDVAFTNMPYVPDAGGSCGAHFVNPGSGGTLDGVTIVGGHEYAETITDQFPAGGYTDSAGNENGDKCAWISSGQGATQDYPFTTTDSFPVQSTWSNLFNSGAGGCEISRPATAGTPDFKLWTSPATQTLTPGTAANFTVDVTTVGGFSGAVDLTASGLPGGATATFSPTPTTNTSTMSVSSTAPVAPGTYPLTVTGTSGAVVHTASVTLVVTQPDFSMNVTPSSQTVTQGASASYSVGISPGTGFVSSVGLVVSGLPSGATATFSPTSTTSTSTLSVTTAASVAAGGYALTITGSGGGLTHTTGVTLVVQAVPSTSAPPLGGTTAPPPLPDATSTPAAIAVLTTPPPALATSVPALATFVPAPAIHKPVVTKKSKHHKKKRHKRVHRRRRRASSRPSSRSRRSARR